VVSVAIKLSRLPSMNLTELKELWRETFQTEPLNSQNRQFMVQRIMYQLQVERYGGLDETGHKRLAAYVDETPKRVKGEHKIARPLPGTIIVRQYRDKEHRVVVLHRGFEYRNVQYNSLTEVAKAITGSHCSGPMFFGLVRPKAGGRK